MRFTLIAVFTLISTAAQAEWNEYGAWEPSMNDNAYNPRRDDEDRQEEQRRQQDQVDNRNVFERLPSTTVDSSPWQKYGR